MLQGIQVVVFWEKIYKIGVLGGKYGHLLSAVSVAVAIKIFFLKIFAIKFGILSNFSYLCGINESENYAGGHNSRK